MKRINSVDNCRGSKKFLKDDGRDKNFARQILAEGERLFRLLVAKRVKDQVSPNKSRRERYSRLNLLMVTRKLDLNLSM